MRLNLKIFDVIRPNSKKNNKFKTWCKTLDTRNRSLTGNLETARLSGQGKAGGAEFRFVSGSDLEEFLQLYEKDKSLTTDQYLDNK